MVPPVYRSGREKAKEPVLTVAGDKFIVPAPGDLENKAGKGGAAR